MTWRTMEPRGEHARHPACIEAERKAREAEDVVAAARHLVSAADACDREAERHPSSRSSAPMVRYVNAMARLREALAVGGE